MQAFQVGVNGADRKLLLKHAMNFVMACPFGIEVAWLAAEKMKAKVREQALTALQSGEIQMLVGTHAIFSKKSVNFANLALVIRG